MNVKKLVNTSQVLIKGCCPECVHDGCRTFEAYHWFCFTAMTTGHFSCTVVMTLAFPAVLTMPCQGVGATSGLRPRPFCTGCWSSEEVYSVAVNALSDTGGLGGEQSCFGTQLVSNQWTWAAVLAADHGVSTLLGQVCMKVRFCHLQCSEYLLF